MSNIKNESNNFKEMINNYVSLIKLKMDTKDCKYLKENNPDEYIKMMYNWLPKFSNEYPLLFKMILQDNDLSMLDLFLDNIEDIDNGKKNINEVRNDLGLLLHNKYINI